MYIPQTKMDCLKWEKRSIAWPECSALTNVLYLSRNACLQPRLSTCTHAVLSPITGAGARAVPARCAPITGWLPYHPRSCKICTSKMCLINGGAGTGFVPDAWDDCFAPAPVDHWHSLKSKP